MDIINEKWSLSKKLDAVVITDAAAPAGTGHDETEYYGGYLVAESIRPHHRSLIAAAPDLLRALVMVRDADDDNKLDGNAGIPSIARMTIDMAIAKALGQ
jgi:hypothetical protein